MPNVTIQCPYCKTIISDKNSPDRCSHAQYTKKIWDFIGPDDFYWNELSQDAAKKFLAKVKTSGWKQALYETFSPEDVATILNANRADWFFYLSNTIKTCLDVGSGFGSIAFPLSKLVDEVWSLERVSERLEFQAIRAEQEQRENIRFIRSRMTPLPFPDNTFDLVAINGVLEWIGLSDFERNPRVLQTEFLKEVYRVLKDDGIVYIGIESRFGVQYLLGSNDHSEMPYTSLLPRRLADRIIRKYRGREKVHPVEWQDYRTYTYTHLGYKKLLKECGFHDLDFYWALPGYSNQRWSGKLDEPETLIHFVHQLQAHEIVPTVRGTLKKLFTRCILSSFGKWVISAFIYTTLYKLFMPSYVMFAYKEKKQETSYEDILKARSHLAYLRNNSTHNAGKLVFHGVDTHEKFHEVAITTRYSEFEEVLDKERQIQRFNTLTSPVREHVVLDRRFVIVPAITGKRADFYSEPDGLKSLDWLIAFQTQTEDGHWTLEELETFLKNQLLPVYSEIQPFFIEFISLLQELRYIPRKVAEHGDFCPQNVFMSATDQEVSLIDWEFYQSSSEEFFDVSTFVVDVFPNYLKHNPHRALERFVRSEPINTYIDYFAKHWEIPREIIAAYLPLCIAKIAARHYALSGQNKWFIMFKEILKTLRQQN